MYSVSSDYKTASKAYSGLRYVTISDGVETITEGDDLIDLKIDAKGGIGQVVIKKATIRHSNSYNFLDKIINIQAGIGLDNIYSALGKTANYTAVAGDDLKHITFTGIGPYTLSLDDAPTLGDGYKLKVTNSTGLPLTINADGSEEIDGELTLTIDTGITVYLKCNGTGWDSKPTDFQIPSYVDYGDFKVHKTEYDKETNETIIEAYDALYESLTDSTLEEVVGTSTVDDLLGLICTAIGVTQATGTYPNYDTVIGSDPYFEVTGTKFRTILEHIAELAGGLIRLDSDGELEIVSLQGSVQEALTLEEQNSLSLESKWGGVNSVVLARSPQEDNIVRVDQVDIDANGLWEIRFENNTLADADREGYIEAIFTELDGYNFYPFETETTGLGYLQVGDRITVQDLSETDFETTIFECNLHFSGGLREVLRADIPAKSKTPYQYAGFYGQAIKNVEIKVDKQEGEIVLLNSEKVGINEFGDLQEDVSTLTQRADSLEITVETIGGANLLKNSTGLAGDTSGWNGEATVLQSEDVVANTESGSAFKLFNTTVNLDTYPESNRDAIDGLSASYTTRHAQSFMAIAGDLDRIAVYIGKGGSPTGNVYAKVYAHTGSYGLSGVPTGSPLATSDAIDVTTITSAGMLTFMFSGAERIALTAQSYCLSIEYTGGDGSNYLYTGTDISTPTHDGNSSYWNGSAWVAQSGKDRIFEVYQEGALNVQYLEQVVSTVIGEVYTFYCLFNKNDVVYLSISGLTDMEITAGGYIDETWAVFKYQFTATTVSTTLRVWSDEVDALCYLADMVLKRGDVTGWTQAPNEVYGRNFRFDKEGFSITSLTDTFKSLLDNTKFAVYDTAGGVDKVIMYISKDSGIVTKLVAQDEFTIQRYENPDSAVRFIPVSDGLFVVVND